MFDSPGMEKTSVFDWIHLNNIEIKDWFLAGGININNIEKASRITKKLDLNSSLEDTEGKKSVEKVSELLLRVKKL